MKLINGNTVSLLVKLCHTIALRVIHPVAENSTLFIVFCSTYGCHSLSMK